MPSPSAASTFSPWSADSVADTPSLIEFGPFRITETQRFPPPPGPQCRVYLTLNAEVALMLPDSPALQALNRSPRLRVSIDSQWLWWALRRKYPAQPLAKLAGSELIYDIAAHCASQGQRLLLLGGSARANGMAVARLRQRWPALHVAGFSPPLFEPGTPGEAHAVAESLDAVQAFAPDYIVLGLAPAKQPRLALKLAPQLDGRVQALLCFGGAIDMAAGQVRRAPRWVQRVGLEGPWRVVQQPSRLWRFVNVLRIVPLLLRRAY